MFTAEMTWGLRAARIWAVTVAWSGVDTWDKTGYVHCTLVLCTITWETRELRRTLAWDCRAVCTADLMVGVRVTTICWTRDSFSDSDTETWERSLAI